MIKELTITDNALSKTVLALFQKKTPKNCVKHRPGAGGMSFPYVEVGYVVNELNNAFGLFWEWKIIDKEVGKKQIWVQGELTVKDPVTNFSITKTQFGGSDIKISRATSEPIDIANDLKAASSDALKKTASLFGIASDIFYKEVDQYESLPTEIPIPTSDEQEARDHLHLMRKMFAIASEKNYTEEDIDIVVKKRYNLDHKKELSNIQLQELIDKLDNAQIKQSSTPIEETPKIENAVEYIPYCVNDQCKKGENGARAIRPETEALFCSPECKEDYVKASNQTDNG